MTTFHYQIFVENLSPKFHQYFSNPRKKYIVIDQEFIRICKTFLNSDIEFKNERLIKTNLIEHFLKQKEEEKEKNSNYYNVKYHIDNYSISLSNYTFDYANGGFNRAGISVITKSKIIHSDFYLKSLLPTVEKTISSYEGKSVAKQILKGLWKDLGKNKRKEIEIECSVNQNSIIQNAYENYNSTEHIVSMCKYLNNLLLEYIEWVFWNFQSSRRNHRIKLHGQNSAKAIREKVETEESKNIVTRQILFQLDGIEF